jgi:hypothetical protein
LNAVGIWQKLTFKLPIIFVRGSINSYQLGRRIHISCTMRLKDLATLLHLLDRSRFDLPYLTQAGAYMTVDDTSSAQKRFLDTLLGKA